jgi:hypothetical protein
MNDTARFVSNLNVARFVDKLRVEHDPATRASLHMLLLEEFNNLYRPQVYLNRKLAVGALATY